MLYYPYLLNDIEREALVSDLPIYGTNAYQLQRWEEAVNNFLDITLKLLEDFTNTLKKLIKIQIAKG